ncbi:MAG TPA: hypothetical protein IAB23_01000 [Candidatus Scybalocola faecavium]|nr:hypothetical protein [Candidatus Scybalocola faecavium]
MPRRKGSRNKAAASVDERIAVVTEEIASLQEQIKEKKAELKKLTAEKEEEDQKRILAAVVESGKSADEVIALIKGITEENEVDVQ